MKEGCGLPTRSIPREEVPGAPAPAGSTERPQQRGSTFPGRGGSPFDPSAAPSRDRRTFRTSPLRGEASVLRGLRGRGAGGVVSSWGPADASACRVSRGCGCARLTHARAHTCMRAHGVPEAPSAGGQVAVRSRGLFCTCVQERERGLAPLLLSVPMSSCGPTPGPRLDLTPSQGLSPHTAMLGIRALTFGSGGT